MFHQPRFFPWIYLGLAILFCFSFPALAQSQAPSRTTGPIVQQSLHHDVSPALRDMPTIVQNPITDGDNDEDEPVRRIPLRQRLTGPLADTAVQRVANAPSPEVAISVSRSFEGLGQGAYSFSVRGAPPDTNGAVGLTQYVQWVNTSYAVFDKATGNLLAGPTAGSTIWAGFPDVCGSTNRGDPIVTYDRIANRWVLSQFAFASTSVAPFLQCIAVSTTSDATGSYNRYSFNPSAGFPTQLLDDYPKMGVWPDAYYESYNMFNGNAFAGAGLCAYDRNAMINGQTALQICFTNSSVGGVLPSDFDGTTLPPNGSPNFMVAFDGNLSSLDLLAFHVDFVTPNNSTLTGPTNIPVAPFSPLCNGRTCVPQPGTTQQLDSLADRLMYRLAYRNFGDHESLVVNHSVLAGSSGGVRWYEIQNPNGSVTVAQQSTFAPDANFRWMGSIAMDQAGDIAMGYSLSSSTVNPSIAVTGRGPSDPANTMQAENVMVNGTGQQVGTTPSGNLLTRWGDYSAMQIDPVDDCTFWFTTEYMKTTGVFNWNTRIMSFKFPGCGVTPHINNLSFNPAGVSGGTPSTGTVTLDIPAPPLGATVSLSSDKNIVQPPATVTVPTGNTTANFTTTPAPVQTIANVTATLGLSSQQATLTVNASASPVLSVHRLGQVLGTVTSDDSNINCGTICSAAYASPNMVTLTATAAAGSTFSGWTGAGCLGTGTCSVTMSSSQSVTANFIAGSGFVPMTPCRVVDTRIPNGSLGSPALVGQNSRIFPITSSTNCTIPTNAAAYSFNVTVVPTPAGIGFLTMYPCGQGVPTNFSTLNSDGRVKAVGAIVPRGIGGDVCAYTTNATDLILDINGYFLPNPSGLAFYPMTPCRLVDTRNPAGALGGPALAGQSTRTFPLRTACGLPGTVQAYSLNMTAVPTPAGIGFLTAWPAGQTQPTASTLNAPALASHPAVANAVIMPAGTNGDVSVFTTHDTDLIIDVNGYFATPAVGNPGLSLFTVTPCRAIDTRLPGGNPPLNGQLDVNIFAGPCTVPSTAGAYVLNATVVPPVFLGFLTLWPQGVTQPTTSILNSFDGAVYSNMAIVPTSNGYVSAFTSSPSHLILDISGYFAGVQTNAPTLQAPQTATAAGGTVTNPSAAPAKGDQ